MTKIVEEQLKRCQFADLSHFDPATNTYYIPKYEKPRYDIGKCYLVKLPGEIVNNTNSILATNWNNGRAPRYPYYKIYVNKAVGHFIQIDGLAYDFENRQDLTDMFSGYLEIDTLTQIGEIR